MNKLALIFGSVLVVAGLFFAATQLMPNPAPQETPRLSMEQLVKDYSPRMGPVTAKVTIVEFLDPECEACAAFFPIVKGLVNDNKDRVQFVVRYMLFHGSSVEAALATEAAGKQGKYWEMQGQLFFRAPEWSHKEKPPVDLFEKYAGELGLDLARFKQDMKDPQILATLKADYEAGKALGIRGTPTIYVNGRQLQKLSYEALKALIDEELAR